MEMERTQVKDSILIPPNVQPTTTMEFLSRSWSLSATEITKAITLPPPPPHKIKNIHHPNYDVVSVELTRENDVVAANPFCNTSHQLIMDRIMSHSQKGSPCNSRRVSHSSDSSPVSPCDMDHEFKYFGSNMSNQYKASAAAGSSKTVGRWLKDRREKRKEETRAQNAQLHAAISVAGVASAVAAIAAATAMSSRASKDKERAVSDTAVASAATLVAAQCVEAAEAMGAEREYLVSVVRSAVNVRSAGDVMTLTAAAATALRAAATLKARALKEVWNITGVIPSEKGIRAVANDGKGWSDGSSNSSFSGELVPEEDFLGICSRELLAKGCELLKKTRNGDLHWKIVSVYINRIGQVILKMKSRHVAGTVTKKKKNVVLDVLKDTSAWPGRHLLEGGEHRRYFALKTVTRGVVEFECRNQRECDVWTQGVSRLLKMVAERNNRHRF